MFDYEYLDKDKLKRVGFEDFMVLWTQDFNGFNDSMVLMVSRFY